MGRSFNVVVTGVKAEASVEEVSARVARLYEVDEAELQKLHENKPLTVVEDASEEDALKDVDILRRSGCVVELTESPSSLARSREAEHIKRYRKARERVSALVRAAEEETGAVKQANDYTLLVGALMFIGLVIGWITMAWFWGFLIAFLIAGVSLVIGKRLNQSAAEEFYTELKPGFIDLVAKEGAYGLVAISALKRGSHLQADRQLVNTEQIQQMLTDFLNETRRMKKDLFQEFSELELSLREIPSLQDAQMMEMISKLKEVNETREKLYVVQKEGEKQRKEAMKPVPDEATLVAQNLHPDRPVISGSAPGFSYDPPAELYSRCLLKPGQEGIILPPVDAGNLRYIKPGSGMKFNGAEIGGDITIAFTKTHMIMGLERSVRWRVGYDCISSFGSSVTGGTKFSGRGNVLDLNIGLEHTYTNLPQKKTSAFVFDIYWGKVPGMAEYCVPRIQEEIDAAGDPRCPACGGRSLKIENEKVNTGVLSSDVIPTANAMCSSCGTGMTYSLSAGGWMAAKDEDMCRQAPLLSDVKDEMLYQGQEIIRRADDMLVAVDVAGERFGARMEIVRAELKKANLGLTLGDMRYTQRERQMQRAGSHLQNEIARVEYSQGALALMFNFMKALQDLQVRLQMEIRDDGPVRSAAEEMIGQCERCITAINAHYARVLALHQPAGQE